MKGQTCVIKTVQTHKVLTHVRAIVATHYLQMDGVASVSSHCLSSYHKEIMNIEKSRILPSSHDFLMNNATFIQLSLALCN